MTKTYELPKGRSIVAEFDETGVGKITVQALDSLICELNEYAERQSRKWIPISERLPEDGTWNLFTDGKCVSVERYKSDAMDHFYPRGRWFSLDEAIAWMPLPEPYEPQESER